MYIYKITNLINNKIYIGQTTRTVKERYLEHCRHNTTVIDKAIAKYGKENFTVETIATASTLEELNKLEMLYIEKYNAMNKALGYNTCRGGDNTKGYHHRTESKAKMSENRKGKYTGSDNPFFGKNHSEEQKKKWSDQRRGRTLTDDWKTKIAKANMRKVINLDTGEVFESVKEASLSVDAPATHITRVCKGKRKRCRGYRWEYAI